MGGEGGRFRGAVVTTGRVFQGFCGEREGVSFGGAVDAVIAVIGFVGEGGRLREGDFGDGETEGFSFDDVEGVVAVVIPD